jgi:putative ABC transport system permease protein
MGITPGSASSVHDIFVKIGDGEDMRAAETAIRDVLRVRHRIQPGQEDDFRLRLLSEIVASREETSRSLAFLLAAVAAVSLLVGGIGIMNIMLVSVVERTREIGLRLAVGARPRDILIQFLTEATALAALGGGFGVLLGVAVSAVLARSAGWPTMIEPAAIFMAVLFSAFIGVFFGLYPARRASLLDPIEALRHP